MLCLTQRQTNLLIGYFGKQRAIQIVNRRTPYSSATIETSSRDGQLPLPYKRETLIQSVLILLNRETAEDD
jgi:hypothetical protein